MAIELSTRARQWVLLGVGVTGLVGLALIVAWVGSDPKPKAKEATKTEIRFNDEALTEEHFTTTYGSQIQTLQHDLEKLQTELRLEAKKREAEEKMKHRAQAANDAMAYDDTFSGNALIAQTTPGASHSVSVKDATPVSRLTIKKVSDIKPQPKEEKSAFKDAIAPNRTREKKAEDLLLTGTFAKATLLNGVEAPTGGQANGNPMPILMELTDAAVLPNRYRSDLKRCFVTATATGDLSSERVLVRRDRLSCITDDEDTIDVKLTGYVTGEDGKTGLKARVVTRSGQAIANALLVGTLSGLGEAVSLAAQDSSTNFAGTVTNSVNNPWRAGIGSGMEDALDRIADYYLKLADKIFPVLEVDAGRTVDIVITQSASIATHATH